MLVLKPSFSGLTGDGATWTLACSCTGEVGTGELAFTVGAGMMSPLQSGRFVVNSVVTIEECFSLFLHFTPDTVVNPFWFTGGIAAKQVCSGVKPLE